MLPLCYLPPKTSCSTQDHAPSIAKKHPLLGQRHSTNICEQYVLSMTVDLRRNSDNPQNYSCLIIDCTTATVSNRYCGLASSVPNPHSSEVVQQEFFECCGKVKKFLQHRSAHRNDRSLTRYAGKSVSRSIMSLGFPSRGSLGAAA